MGRELQYIEVYSMIDIHCHVLPGVDDGSRNLNESIEMLQMAASVGVKVIYATPHAKKRVDWAKYEAAYHATANEARKLGIDLRLGSEILYDLLLKLEADELPNYCYRNTNTLLLEFHSQIVPPRWEYTLSALKDAGYQVVIAHPERYRFIQDRPELVMEFRRYGALIQLDAESFLDKPWERTYRTARKVLKDGLANFVSSDAHTVAMYQQYGTVHQKYAQWWPADREI